MAEAVIGSALFRILEDLVGLVDFLEAMLAAGIAGIAVRMPLHRELAERRFELAVGGTALDFEDFVIAALGHARIHPRQFGSIIARYAVAHRDLGTHFSKNSTPGTSEGAVFTKIKTM